METGKYLTKLAILIMVIEEMDMDHSQRVMQKNMGLSMEVRLMTFIRDGIIQMTGMVFTMVTQVWIWGHICSVRRMFQIVLNPQWFHFTYMTTAKKQQ